MFNQNLRIFREKKGITQIQMAKLLGIPVTTYRNYENTSRQPDFDVLVNMSEILEISIDKLLGNNSLEGIHADLFLKIKLLSATSINELNSFVEYLLFKEKQ